MEIITKKLMALLNEKSNAADAVAMKAYLRNQFEFFGVKADERRDSFKTVLKENGLPEYQSHFKLAEEWFNIPQREMHHCAIELTSMYKKHWDKHILKHIDFIAENSPWWDTIDTSNSLIVSPYLFKHAEDLDILTKWNSSSNIWLIRLSIIYQLFYKAKTDTDILAAMILPHTTSKEFFIQKAIGWALRNYSRVNPIWVQEFVRDNEMKPLSKREALRLIK